MGEDASRREARLHVAAWHEEQMRKHEVSP